MRLLELFSGTGSFGQPFRNANHDVISVDIDPTFNPEICEDILTFSYCKLPWVPDIIWGSPPCTEYSRAKSRGIRKLEYADSLVQKFIEIRDFYLELNPSLLWFCENGLSTLLWEREVGKTLVPRVVVSYCQYGGPGYQKNTCIATNAIWNPRPKCNPKTCAQVVDGRHWLSAQQGPCKAKGKRRPTKEDKCSLNLLHRLPTELCDEIYKICVQNQWEILA